MTYVVTEKCIKCKYTDCVEVCPVDCFHEGENMLAINPKACIDCGVCEAECPVGAIKPESEELLEWIEYNNKATEKWPNITVAKLPYENADENVNLPNKKQYLEKI